MRQWREANKYSTAEAGDILDLSPRTIDADNGNIESADDVLKEIKKW